MRFHKLTARALAISLLLTFNHCHSQVEQTAGDGQARGHDRRPAYAGKFYPADSTELMAQLKALFSAAKPRAYSNVHALLVPHAGYVFSGEVAASAYNQLDPAVKYDNVFILASSHRTIFSGTSIYSEGNYLTPLGPVRVNTELARSLASSDKILGFGSQAHTDEHSLEVQLPFLQYVLKNDLRIVPIIIATQDPADCRKIAACLKPYFNGKNIFVISTDFSHYPSYDDAVRTDKTTADAILSNSPSTLLETIDRQEKQGIKNLETCLCGWSSVLTLLHMTEGDEGIKYSLVEYKNSGDNAQYGDREAVVGYNAIVVTGPGQTDNQDSGYNLTEDDKASLLGLARRTILRYLLKGEIPRPDPAEFSASASEKCGAFVTLNKEGNLRGCIGRFTSDQPLYEVVQQMAIASATQDSRFLPVTKEELGDLEIEISVLTPMRKITSLDEIVLGKHGIYIKKGSQSGTFLPQVAKETGWSKEEFLGHCARDKAGIGWDGWKKAEIFIYEAEVFSEKEFR
jgi:AmmeMemoRadiSam system protein B/AmmeMemoRadiSam system protein A